MFANESGLSTATEVAASESDDEEEEDGEERIALQAYDAEADDEISFDQVRHVHCLDASSRPARRA